MKILKILVACEESQTVTKAFRAKGHEAFSCDIENCSGGHPEWHIQGDALKILGDGWDLLIAHPPCTYLSFAAMHYWNREGRWRKRLEALEFFGELWDAPIARICLENPKSCASPVIAKYTQEIQPYYFGDSDMKTTWLWLKNLPPLVHFKVDDMFDTKTHVDKPQPTMVLKSGKKIYFEESLPPSADRARIRSKTFPGIAQAMADQWGNL